MANSSTQTRMRELVDILNRASKLYYSTGESFLTDHQYDKLLEELTRLEEELGYILADSPNKNVGAKENGRVVKHYTEILSLKHTKDVDDLLYFLGEREGVLSWKLDGVSIVLYYKDGQLHRALTRGDGYFGKDITDNILKVRNVPKKIAFDGFAVVRGEACISFDDFETIKRTEQGEKFSNPRNLCAGILNTIKGNNDFIKHVSFIAHTLIYFEDYKFYTREEQLSYLRDLGFEVVPHIKVANYEIKKEVENFTKKVEDYEYPVDGLVLVIDDIQYGESLGATQKFPRHSLAFKWPDETALTTVTGVEWSVSNTGLITPIVTFDPVKLEGTMVKKANLHSLRIFNSLGIGVGDVIRIFKANKIVPEVDDNLTRSATEEYPKTCPKCGWNTRVVRSGNTEKLYCDHCKER